MSDPFAMPDLALEDRVQALEMNLITALARIRVLEMRSMRTARSGDADTGRAGGDALTEQDAAAIVAAATTGIATAGSQDDDRVTRDPVSDVITGEVADAYAEHYRRSRGMMPGRSERRPNGEIVEVYVPDGSTFGSRCPGEKCGGRGRIHDAERRCAECGGR